MSVALDLTIDAFYAVYPLDCKPDEPHDTAAAIALLPRIDDVDHDDTGWPIRTAAKLGDTALVKALLDHGAKACLSSALRNAVYRDHVECAKLLIDAGATTDGYNTLSIEWLKFVRRNAGALGEYANKKLW